MLLEVFLTDVVDDVVLLPGGELRHGHHHIISLCEGLEHAERIVAVLEFPFVKLKSDGNRAFLFVGAVAGDAELIVDFLPASEGTGIPC